MRRSRSPRCIWVPHHHVGVGARDDATFARVKVVDLRSIRAGYSHKTILVHFPCNLPSNIVLERMFLGTVQSFRITLNKVNNPREGMRMFTQTYHCPFPDDAHPVLDSGHSVRDLCEVVFAQSSLLGSERTVFRRHNAQRVTENRVDWTFIPPLVSRL